MKLFRILTPLLVLALTVGCAGGALFTTPTPTPTVTPTITSTPKPTATPTKVPTPTLSPDCDSPEARTYVSKSSVIWTELWTIDEKLVANFDLTTGQLISTKGFKEASVRTAELAKLQAEISVPSLYADYNTLSVKALEVYSTGLDKFSTGDVSNASMDMIDFNAYGEQSDIEWARIANYCQWPTPTPLPTST